VKGAQQCDWKKGGLAEGGASALRPHASGLPLHALAVRSPRSLWEVWSRERVFVYGGIVGKVTLAITCSCGEFSIISANGFEQTEGPNCEVQGMCEARQRTRRTLSNVSMVTRHKRVFLTL